ncbi:MAG: hypothetical protein GY774_08870 [Planctomycetes bacterium]|nr:hypothetical protein [Planctomycetota bacterium]
MKSAENIEKLIKNLDLDIDTNVKTDQRILKKIIETHEKSKQMKSALVESNIRRTIMKNPITKLAVAAVVITVVALGLFEFIDTGSTSGIVWAEVAQKVESSRGVIYRTRKIGMGDPNDDWPKAHVVHHKSPLHSRTDWYRGGQIRRTMNFDLSTKTQVWLAHDAKAYDRQTMTEETVQSVQSDQKSGWLRPEDITSKILSFENWKVGTKTIDGVLCEGLETNDPAVCGAPPTKTFVGRLWVSVETGYPVLIEVEATDGEDGSIQMKGFVDQFQWDVEFSPGDRQISIPPGFRSLGLEGEMKILSDQGKKELLKVEETIVDGTGRMRTHVYRYQLSDGQIKDNREAAAYEVDDMAHRKKFSAQLNEIRQLKKTGPGEDLGTYEETVEGRVFSFKREKYLLSDGTEVIWSIGRPK